MLKSYKALTKENYSFMKKTTLQPPFRDYLTISIVPCFAKNGGKKSRETDKNLDTEHLSRNPAPNSASK